MTEAPERIWASKSTKGKCVVSFSTPSEEYCIPYVRKDVADLARPVTVAEAARVLLADVLDENGSEQWDNLSMTQENKLVAILQSLSHK